MFSSAKIINHENLFAELSKCFEIYPWLSFLCFRSRYGPSKADHTRMTLTDDHLHVQCYTGSRTTHLCGKNGVPRRNQPSATMIITGAKFVPRAHPAWKQQWVRNRYTWKVTYYDVVGTMATCRSPGIVSDT